MHPRKMYNPNRGKRHAARLPGKNTQPWKGQVRFSRRDPVERQPTPYTAT